MALTRTIGNENGAVKLLRYSWLLLGIAAAVFCAGCGCDSDGSEASIEITKPRDGTELTYEDDEDPDRPGFQYTVSASTENIDIETAIELQIDGDSFDSPVNSGTDEDGLLRFVNVTLPDGVHELKVGTPTGSVFSDSVEYTLYNLVIKSPADGKTLSSDSNSSKDGLQSDVVVNVYGFDKNQEIVLTVTDEDDDSKPYKEETSDSAEDEMVSVTFESVTFPYGEVTLLVSAEVNDDTTAESLPHTVTVVGESGPAECPAGTHEENGLCVADAACLANSCSGHGSCDISSGEVVCTCDDGYIGTYCDECDDGYHPSGRDCEEDEQCPRTNPCSGKGTCDDSTGEAICTCNDGYTGDTCNRCSAGFHLDDGECVIDQQCLPTSCNGHGDCSLNTDGQVECDCDTGYDGTYCDECDTGYHESGDDCVEDGECPETDACSGHGSCDDSTGVPICTCDGGYEGSDCDDCAGGYHADGDSCVKDQSCLPTSCSYHGMCDDSSGAVICSCTGGFTASSYCTSCSTGFHPSGNQCVLNETCGTNTCNQHGSCEVVDNETVCECDQGWTGDTCSGCAAGFHLDDGACVLDQSCLPSSCAGHGDCDDSGGVVVCTCETGYTSGSYCLDCATDYHKNNGECVPDEECDADSCNDHGDCDDATGAIVCDCDTGWDGDTCSYCAPGYHFEQGGTVCAVDTGCLLTSCAGNGSCNDDAGYIVCTCDPGYDPATFCAECAIGYHDEGGSCVVNEECVADSCNDHGTCDDSTGVIECTCDVGYAGDYCDGCNTGAGYSSCNSECCSSSQVCYGGGCCTPDTCDDLASFQECGESGVTNNCGGTINCGDCGDNGSCVSNTCDCDDNYGMLEDGHVCVHACSGYLPAVKCCDEGWLVYCNDDSLEWTDCGMRVPPDDVCGWSDDRSYFKCGGLDPVPGGQSLACPSNIVIDKNPTCIDDEAYEDNDIDAEATPVQNGSDIFATKCGGDRDLYSIDLAVGDTLTAAVYFNESSANLDIGIWYPASDIVGWTNLLAYVWDGGDEETAEWTATEAGTYYVEVFEVFGDSTGYELVITVN